MILISRRETSSTVLDGVGVTAQAPAFEGLPGQKVVDHEDCSHHLDNSIVVVINQPRTGLYCTNSDPHNKDNLHCFPWDPINSVHIGNFRSSLSCAVHLPHGQ